MGNDAGLAKDPSDEPAPLMMIESALDACSSFAVELLEERCRRLTNGTFRSGARTRNIGRFEASVTRLSRDDESGTQLFPLGGGKRGHVRSEERAAARPRRT